MLSVVQSTLRNTPARRPSTRPVLRARTTTSCPPWQASTTTTTRRNRQVRWMTYEASVWDGPSALGARS